MGTPRNMSKRISMAMAVVGAVGPPAGGSRGQPAAGCFVQDSSTQYLWQAKYILKDPSQASLSCGKFKGEDMGVLKYADPEASADVVAANQASRVGIRPRALAALTRASYQVDRLDADGKPVLDEDGKPVKDTINVDRIPAGTASSGSALSTTLAQQPDDDGLCLATGFNTATVAAAAAYKQEKHGGALLAPAQTLSYTYENVEVYSAPSAPGTQLRGTVKIDDGVCTAEYEMWALWPSRSCEPDEPLSSTNCGDAPNLNPDFDVVCAPDIATGWPARRPPSFKNQWPREGAAPPPPSLPCRCHPGPGRCS